MEVDLLIGLSVEAHAVGGFENPMTISGCELNLINHHSKGERSEHHRVIFIPYMNPFRMSNYTLEE